MKKEVTIFQAHPVLSRFKHIRAGWLGLIAPKQRRQAKKRKMLFLSLGKKITRLRKRADTFSQKMVRMILNSIIAVTAVVSLIWLGPKLFYAFIQPGSNQTQAEELSGNFQLQIDQEKIEAEKAQRILELSKPPYNE